MSESQYLGIIGSFWMILTGILGWIGIRIFNKLDSLSTQMTDINTGLQRQLTDGDNILHGRINEIDRRVTRVETRCHIEHEAGK